MKKLVTMGIALLLLGLAVGMPYRAMGAEEAISMPRAQGILEHTSGMSLALGLVAGLITGLLGFGSCAVPGAISLGIAMVFAMVGLMLCILIITIPLGLIFLFLGMPFLIFTAILGLCGVFCGFICALSAGIITYCVAFPFELIESIESCPYRFADWVVRNLRQLIDACVPF